MEGSLLGIGQQASFSFQRPENSIKAKLTCTRARPNGMPRNPEDLEFETGAAKCLEGGTRKNGHQINT